MSDLDSQMEFFGHAAVVSGVLAGFGFEAVVHLATLKPSESRRHNTLIAAVLTSMAAASSAQFLSLVGCFLGWLMGEMRTNVPQERTDRFLKFVTQMRGFVATNLFSGILALLIGIALVGWLRARWVGAITTVVSAIALMLIAYAFLFIFVGW